MKIIEYCASKAKHKMRVRHQVRFSWVRLTHAFTRREYLPMQPGYKGTDWTDFRLFRKSCTLHSFNWTHLAIAWNNMKSISSQLSFMHLNYFVWPCSQVMNEIIPFSASWTFLNWQKCMFISAYWMQSKYTVGHSNSMHTAPKPRMERNRLGPVLGCPAHCLWTHRHRNMLFELNLFKNTKQKELKPKIIDTQYKSIQLQGIMF